MNASFLPPLYRPGRVLLSSLCLAILPLLSWGQAASPAGQLALEENIDYASGTQLAASQTAASATGWYQNGATATNPITTVTGNLSSSTQQYPQGVLAAASVGTSTEVTLATSGQSVYKRFTQPTGATVVYAAALLTVNSAQTGDYFLHFISAAAPGAATDARGQVYVRTAGSGTFNFGLALADALPFSYGTTAYTIGTTYLVVLKYENSSATNGVDATSLFVIDPTAVPTLEPTTPEISVANSANAVQTTLNAIGLRQGGLISSPTVTLDAVRVASGWGAAVGRVVYSTGTTNTVTAGSYYSLRVSNVGTTVAVNGTGPGNGVTAATSVTLEKQLNLDGGQVVTTATNVLLLRYRNIIGDGFQIDVNLGGTSYVDGPLSREATGGPSLLFPLGRNSNYRPMTLNITTATAGTTIYTGSQTEASAYSADAVVNSPLARVSRIRYFTIAPNPVPATGIFQGTLQMTFGNDDGVTDPSLATFVIAKSDGAGWNNVGRSQNGMTTITSAPFQNFSAASNFSLASTNASITTNPLPVSLTGFTAVRSGSNVSLAWATASEQNSARFDVERSLDGTSFAKVATLAAAGSSLLPRTYATLDRDAPTAALYYRLRAVDADGSSRYSAVVVVAGNDAELALSPNPARSEVRLLTATATPYVLRSTLGQVVLSGTTQAGTATTVQLQDLAAGVYLFELQAGAGRVVRKLVKE